MKKNLILIFVLFIGTISGTIAQDDYEAGYVITNNLDTIYGKIENNNYFKNASYCNFKTAHTRTVTKYSPDMLFGYRFTNGKFYITKEVDNKKIFLEYLVNGDIDFYFYQDVHGENHFYLSKDTLPLRELLWSDHIKKIDGKDMLYHSKPFTGLLYYYTLDCPAIKDKIFKLKKPTYKNLIKFSEEYQALTCSSGTCIIYEKRMPRKIKISVSGGSNWFFSDISEIDRKTFPSYGFNILFQQAQRQESFYLGLGYFREGKIKESASLYRIPLSINYLNPALGLTPFISYQLDLNTFLLTQAVEFGFKYQMQKVAISLIAEFKTAVVVKPYAFTLQLGMLYDVR